MKNDPVKLISWLRVLASLLHFLANISARLAHSAIIVASRPNRLGASGGGMLHYLVALLVNPNI